MLNTFILFAVNNNDAIEEEAHNDIKCDECGENPIRGKRFRCLECIDYDLCGKCKALDIHNEHRMEQQKAPLKRGKASR